MIDELLAGLPADECERLYKAARYNWGLWARPNQIPPAGEWDVWGLIGGRGSGKTRPGAEWMIGCARRIPGGRGALLGRTARDTRDTMVLGESGILACSPPWFRPRYYPSRSLVLWPNGFRAHLYSADEPDLLRGPQHHVAWPDEFATITKPEAWKNLQDGLRLGERPQVLLTTTPRRTELFLDTVLGPRDPTTRKRPITPEMIASWAWEFSTVSRDHYGRAVAHRSVFRRYRTEENALHLAPGFAAKRRAAYGGSSYGQMELDAAILEMIEGALWNLAQMDKLRVPSAPAHVRRVVSVDPSHAADGYNDACGIIVAGLGEDSHGYVLADRTLNASPNAWGHAAVEAYDDFRADLIIYENNAPPGKPDVVPDVIRSVDPKGRIRWLGVYASRDKRTRADPVASLYEQGRVHHVKNQDNPGHLAHLEEEMVGWDPWDPKAKSPNRVDALVHGIGYLMLQGPGAAVAPMSVGEKDSNWR